MEQFLVNNWQAITAVIGSIVVWTNKKNLARWALKKEETSYHSAVIDSLEKAMSMYTAMLDDVESRHMIQLEKRDAEILEFIHQLEKRDEEIKQLTAEVKLLRAEIESYINRNDTSTSR